MEDIKTFNSLVEKYTIVIPHIQRDYVQGSNKHNEKRDRFIGALVEHLCSGEPLHLNFIYGSCDEKKKDVFYPLDGQQRLTTLFLLRWFLEVRTNRRNNKKVILSYQSRRSSEQFCAKLSTDTFDASFNGKKFSEYIEDEKVWFVKDWLSDPTIKAMMEMLDALQLKLECNTYPVEALNKMLNNFDIITFDHLDLKDYHLNDTLYIKMNERGKHLTDFENWKALFIAFLEKEDRETYLKRFEQSIEHEWTDMLWTYSLQRWNTLTDKEKENAPYPAIDNSFMNLLLFVHRMLFFATNPQINGKDVVSEDFNNTLASMEQIFSDHKNLQFLFDFLDVWSDIKKEKGIDTFLDMLLGGKGVSLHNEGNGVNHDNPKNLFVECIDNAEGMNVGFQILFYAISKYCIKRRCYTVSDELKYFVRICRNLIESELQFNHGAVRYESNIRITDWSKYKFAIDTIVNNLINGTAWLDGVSGLGDSEHEKDKFDNYHQYLEFINRWEEKTMFKGCLRAVLPALKNNTAEEVDKAIDALDAANDTEKVQVLVAFDYNGYNVGDCDYHTRKRLFFGAKDRWDVIFRRDNENVQTSFSKYVAAYNACPNISELIKQEGSQAKWNTFRYYMLKYDNFVHGNEETHYFAVKGELDDLDMINIKFSRMPLSGYYCNSFAYVVSKDVDCDLKHVLCWGGPGSEYPSSVECHTPNGDVFAKFYSTKEGWILRKEDTMYIEHLEELYEQHENKDNRDGRNFRLEDNGNKDLIELGIEVTKKCVKRINEIFNKG